FAMFMALGVLGACVAGQGDEEELGANEQLSSGSGSADAGVPDAGPAQVCCTLHYDVDQSCTTDKTGLPVLSTHNSAPRNIRVMNDCADSYSSEYDPSSTANGTRCIWMGSFDIWPHDTMTASYKIFHYGVLLGTFPDTAAGAQTCTDRAAGYRVGLTNGGF
ncbi:MAG: hypothetical protein ABI175_14900, partial [Polyangiales bacterium]